MSVRHKVLGVAASAAGLAVAGTAAEVARRRAKIARIARRSGPPSNAIRGAALAELPGASA